MKTRIIGAIAIACLVVMLTSGCTEQQRAKNWGGTATIELPEGKKLVMVTWKNDEIWFLTRDMRAGDLVETYEFSENSSWGFMEGTVIIKEASLSGNVQPPHDDEP